MSSLGKTALKAIHRVRYSWFIVRVHTAMLLKKRRYVQPKWEGLSKR